MVALGLNSSVGGCVGVLRAAVAGDGGFGQANFFGCIHIVVSSCGQVAADVLGKVDFDVSRHVDGFRGGQVCGVVVGESDGYKHSPVQTYVRHEVKTVAAADQLCVQSVVVSSDS